MMYSNKLQQAIKYAIDVHKGQTRKGKPNEPYITHPLSVGLILSRCSANDDVIIAGILHDTIEDCKSDGSITKEIIAEKFGANVARMVDDVTEQEKSLSWAERKRLALEHVKEMKKDSVMVKSADVLHNLRDQISDYEDMGNKMFERFNAPKSRQLERYQRLFVELEKAYPENPLLPELKEAVNRITELWK